MPPRQRSGRRYRTSRVVILPRIRITELLTEVARRTGFLSAFTDLRSGRPHDNPNAVLAAIMADASNLGLERMANASQGISYAQLAWTHNWYLREETYRAALAAIIDAHHAHPFADIWGQGTRAALPGPETGAPGTQADGPERPGGDDPLRPTAEARRARAARPRHPPHLAAADAAAAIEAHLLAVRGRLAPADARHLVLAP
jgi:hypothetical protein